MVPFVLMLLLAGPEDRTPARGSADLQRSLDALREVGANGKGSQAAAEAWREVARAPAERLPQLLAAMDGASTLACNWLRPAIDQVVTEARANRRPLPDAALESFVLDSRHNPQARRLAYDLIVENDKTLPERLLPRLLDDPNPNLRRDAVAHLLARAEKVQTGGKKEAAIPLFERAFASARDKDQIDQCANRLKELGKPVDIASHLGLLLNWKLIGSFPNKEQKGVEQAFPPEQKIDLAAEYDGKSGKVHWKDYVSASPYGAVDLNAGVGQETEAVAYALTEFTSAAPREVEIRLGCITVFKLWVNGELVLSRGDAYTGMSLDHYIARAHLKQGKNEILLKLCQDIPPPPLPKVWRFMLRVCDENGTAILSTTRPPPPAKKS